MGESEPGPLGWCIVELLGHRRVAGFVTEVQIAGAGFLRVEVPSVPSATQFVSPGSVYALTPTTEEIVCRVAQPPTPVSRWELPAAAVVTVPKDDPWVGDEPADEEIPY
jgi:hypothetical protein